MKVLDFVKSRQVELVSALVLFVVLCPFLMLCLYAHPSFVDDYAFATKTLERGLSNAVADWYNNWTGRYSLCFIMSFNYIVLKNLLFYRLILVVLILLLPVLFFFLLKTVFANSSFSFYASFTSIFTFLYYYQLPSINEGVFWMTGAMAYQLPTLCLLLFFIVLFNMLNERGIKWINYIVLCVLAVVIIGTNEISMAIFVFLIIAILLFRGHQKISNNKGLVVIVIVAIICSLCVVLAPGNEVREQLFPLRSNGLQTIQMIVLGFGYYVGQWLVMVCLLTIPLFYLLGKFTLGKALDCFSLPLSFSITLFVSVLLVGFLVPAWSTGQMPNPRAINVIFFIFLGGVFYHIIYIYQFLVKHNQFQGIGKISTLLVVIAVFLITFYPTQRMNNNIKDAYIDCFSGKAIKFSAAMTNSYNTTSLPILSIDSRPVSFMLEISSQNYKGVPELYFNKYYRKK